MSQVVRANSSFDQEKVVNSWATRNVETWNEKMELNLVSASQWEAIAKAAELSQRELEIIQLLFQQKTRDGIAEKLGLKSRIVRQYMERIHTKLQVHGRIGVVLRIIQIRDTLPKSVKGMPDHLL
jgi:DNA-binding NarL/FixJ family response regulator